MNRILFAICVLFLALLACNKPIKPLPNELQDIINDYDAEIGLALIYDNNDTLVLNNQTKYPMMSVFKLHQAIATCAVTNIDSALTISRTELNPNTWSPMLKDCEGDTLHLTVADLIAYALQQSDNNASNYLFAHFVAPAQVDSFIATIIPRSSFAIKHTEEAMQGRHELAYENATSPLGAAELINKLYTDSAVAALPNADFIRQCLDDCQTGTDRIVAPLLDKEGITIGHKTGSGYTENGILAAHNDVAFVRLPDGHHYALAIFVKDIRANPAEASQAIARLSQAIHTAR